MNIGKLFFHFSILFFLGFFPVSSYAQEPGVKELKNELLRIEWKNSDSGYVLCNLQAYNGFKWEAIAANVLGNSRYTILYDTHNPSAESWPGLNQQLIDFPEPEYRYITDKWKDATTSVALNKAGESYSFFPKSAEISGDFVVFRNEDALSTTSSSWALDTRYKNDIVVTIKLKAKKSGYFSIETPALLKADKQHFNWGVIPGVLQGKTINHDFVDAYAYGHGIPAVPFVARERAAAALTSILTDKNGWSIGVTAAPGTGRDPWLENKFTHKEWLLGLSLISRQGDLTPTLYHPVLGEKYSYLNAGDSISFSFRYTIQQADWYKIYQHVVNDIYRFNDFLTLKKTKESLTSRLLRLLEYVKSDSTSKWRNTEYNGITIGAQDYLGGVFESKKDAIKNADYGAMWMLAEMTGDTVLKNQRLPQALHFKLAQQNIEDSFFYGAAAGQYYLYSSKRFTEEWGPYTEPIATTYYLICDIANLLLFEPNQPALKKELTLAADWLLRTMKPDGSWEIAYSNTTYKPLFDDQKDYRPTFYGLLVAYTSLKEQKYLQAAIKGADWFIKNAVDNGYFLGVCGDTRFAPDFATAQSVQALLDLYSVTAQIKYKEAAIKVARMYTTSIYSHPIPSSLVKEVKGKKVQDWEISQAGLGFEHGGTIGSANNRGPILLASHAGMFVRLFGITGDSLFLNMARAAAWGRDAFVDSATGVVSYYWNAMNAGAGPYPHHSWWQIGWMTDYLLSEITLRSENKIVFPQGFITPKVGPHLTYGFSSGTIFDAAARLFLRKGFVSVDNPYIENVTAVSEDDKHFFIILLNNSEDDKQVNVSVDFSKFLGKKPVQVADVYHADYSGKFKKMNRSLKHRIHIKSCGITILKIKVK